MPINEIVQRIRQIETATVKAEVKKVEEAISEKIREFSPHVSESDEVLISVIPTKEEDLIHIVIRVGQLAKDFDMPIKASFPSLAGGLRDDGFEPLFLSGKSSAPKMELKKIPYFKR